jgi:hypothetical protein
MAVFIIAVLLAAGLAAQPVTVKLDKGFTLTAEYLVHSLPAPEGTLVANDYLVVDVKFAGPAPLQTSAGQFLLRINARTVIEPDSAGDVSGSLKYPDWTQKPVVTGTAGPVMIGSSPTVERFPGDPTVGHVPMPRAPEPDSPVEKAPAMSIDERVQKAAMVEGESKMPVSGLLYFPFQGKTKKIKSVELVYQGPAGRAEVKLP